MRQIINVLIMMVIFSPLGSADSLRSVTLTEVMGKVEYRMSGSSWQKATEGVTLHMGDKIRTGLDGTVLLLLDEGRTGKIEVYEESTFKLTTLTLDEASGDKQTLLDLAIGRVIVEATKLEGDSKFEVKTPTTTAGVRGTRYEIVAR